MPLSEHSSANPSHQAGPGLASLHQQLQALRPQLFSFALLQLRDGALADDAVQEALMAVLEQPQRFEGRASLRTYVTGILKFKIIDLLRSASRERGRRQEWTSPQDDAAGRSDDEAIDALFLADGHTREPPRQWGDPDSVLEQKDFFRVLETCLEKLPAQTARIFLMREWLELDTDAICRELEVSQANVWVILYRARIRLRECLDLHWFGRAAP